MPQAEPPTWNQFVITYAAMYQIPYSLMRGVIWVESTERVDAGSYMGAIGLCQVMPMHFSWGQNPWDPETNISVGCRILADCKRRFKTWPAALAAYNGSLTWAGYIKNPKYVMDVFNAQQAYI